MVNDHPDQTSFHLVENKKIKIHYITLYMYIK